MSRILSLMSLACQLYVLNGYNMPIETSSTSRFTITEAIIRDGKETFGRWTRPDFTDLDTLNEEDIIVFNVDSSFAGRPDLIAFDQYGSSLLEWVVVMSNRPKNPVGFPRIGSVIRLPSRSLVLVNV